MSMNDIRFVRPALITRMAPVSGISRLPLMRENRSIRPSALRVAIPSLALSSAFACAWNSTRAIICDQRSRRWPPGGCVALLRCLGIEAQARELRCRDQRRQRHNAERAWVVGASFLPAADFPCPLARLALDHGADSYISRRNSMYTDAGLRSVDRGGVECVLAALRRRI